MVNIVDTVIQQGEGTEERVVVVVEIDPPSWGGELEVVKTSGGESAKVEN